MPLSWKLAVDSRGGSGSTELRLAYAPLAQQLPFLQPVSYFGWKHRSYKWRVSSQNMELQEIRQEMPVRLFSTAVFALVTLCCPLGQTYTINAFAGNGTIGYSGDNGPAVSAQLNQPWGVAVDAAGNLIHRRHR
jgi:hypothetical protein